MHQMYQQLKRSCQYRFEKYFPVQYFNGVEEPANKLVITE